MKLKLPGRAARAARARAKKGAKFLDVNEPRWYRSGSVRLGTLDLEDSCDCVLGQMYGDYGEGRRRLGISLWDGSAPADLGFVALNYTKLAELLPKALRDDEANFTTAYYDELTAAWKDEIRSRRARDRVAA